MSGQLAIGIDIGGTKVAGGVVDADGPVVWRGPAATRRTGRQPPEVVEDTIVDVVDELVETVRPTSSARSWPSGSARPGSSRPTGRPSSSPRTCRGGTSRCARRCRGGCRCRSSSTTTPTPPPGPSGGSAPARGESHLVMRQPRHRHRRRASSSTARCSAGATASRGSSGTCRWCPAGIRCECGNRGCWEQYASGNALVREARDADRGAVARWPPTCSTAVGGDPSKLTGPLDHRGRPATGDPTAIELLAEVGAVARGRHRQPRGGLRPGHLRHRRRA